MFEVKPYSLWHMGWVAAGSTWTSSSTSANATPRQSVSNLDHFVTQWMSTTTSDVGRAWTSAHDNVFGSATSPPITMAQSDRSLYSGTLPACSTGNRSVKYWPGGSREGSIPRSSSALRLRSKKPMASAFHGSAPAAPLRCRGDLIGQLDPHPQQRR